MGRVALAKGRDHRRVKAEVLKLTAQALGVEDVAEVAELSLDLGLCGGTAVPDDAGLDTESSGIERRARRQARSIRRVTLLKDDALPGQSVDVGAGSAMVSVAAQVIGPQRIDVDIENSHKSG